MGKSDWSESFYASRATMRASAGLTAKKTTEYTAVMDSVPLSDRKVNNNLDPKKIKSPVGKFRESRDSAEHPESIPIAVWFDQTGSMQQVPAVLQSKLGGLMALLLKKGYVDHPQVLFGAIGDAHWNEIAPVQMGQFESGVEMDQDLDKIYLEGQGGGGGEESYDLALYMMAKHTVTDAWEKRNKKGYLFLIGDEKAYPRVDRELVEKYIDDKLEANIPLENILDEVREKWEVFFILPSGSHHFNDPDQHKFWRNLLGQNFMILDNPDNVAETIATTIGVSEGRTGAEDLEDDLKDTGADPSVVASVTKAIVPMAKGKGLSKASKMGVELPEVVGSGTGGAKRL